MSSKQPERSSSIVMGSCISSAAGSSDCQAPSTDDRSPGRCNLGQVRHGKVLASEIHSRSIPLFAGVCCMFSTIQHCLCAVKLSRIFQPECRAQLPKLFAL